MTERCLPASLRSHACRPSVRLGHERSDTSSNDTHDEVSQGVRAVCAPPGDRRGAEGPERSLMGPPATMAGVRGPSRTLRACCMTTHSEKSPRTPRGHTGVGGCPQQLPPNKRLCPDRPQNRRGGEGGFRWQETPKVTGETVVQAFCRGTSAQLSRACAAWGPKLPVPSAQRRQCPAWSGPAPRGGTAPGSKAMGGG